jgi:hypothetical protein
VAACFLAEQMSAPLKSGFDAALRDADACAVAAMRARVTQRFVPNGRTGMFLRAR